MRNQKYATFLFCSIFVLVGLASPALSQGLGCLPQRVLAFSKDICDGKIGDGDAVITQCEEDGAITLCVRNAIWKWEMIPNEKECVDCNGDVGRCDETAGRKDGTLVMETDFTLRINGPCRFRGCWTGRWRFEARDGTVFAGRAMGTFGVGTHRPLFCAEVNQRDCERCHDVEFQPIQGDLGLWRIGVEGSLLGDVISPVDPPRESLCFSLSGDLFALGTCDGGPSDPNSFRFQGTADGVLNQLCEGGIIPSPVGE